MRKQRRDGVLNMLKVREILRLFAEGLNQTEISAASGVSRAAVQDYIRRAQARGVTYSDVKELSDEELRARLGKTNPGRHPKLVSFEPNFATLDAELDRKGMTLALLWQEWSPRNSSPKFVPRNSSTPTISMIRRLRNSSTPPKFVHPNYFHDLKQLLPLIHRLPRHATKKDV